MKFFELTEVFLDRKTRLCQRCAAAFFSNVKKRENKTKVTEYEQPVQCLALANESSEQYLRLPTFEPRAVE